MTATATTAPEGARPRRRRLLGQLWVWVVVAIALGIVFGLVAPDLPSMRRLSTTHSGWAWSSWLMRRITLMRGTIRSRVIDGASVRLANATTSALNRGVANERSRIWVSIGTGGIYRENGRS